MRMMRWVVVAAVAGVAVVAPGCGGGDEAGSDDGSPGASVEAGATLVATVGPGFDIGLTTQDGQAVASAAPGEYTIQVSDRSSIHNFHLTGPGLDEDSGLAEEGESTWTVTFEPGSYAFVCDPHSSMRGDFEVTA